MGSHTIEGDPDRHLTTRAIPESSCKLMSGDLMAVYMLLLNGIRIGVHERSTRNRYSVLGRPLPRRIVDRLIYFGVIDVLEMRGGCDGEN